MIRTMTISLALACMAAAVVAGGCSGKYKRKELSQDAERAKEITRMVRQLRSCGEGELDRVIAGQTVAHLDEGQARMAKAALKKLAQAEKVQVLLTDRYGAKVYRVSFRLTISGRPQSLTMLLVPDENDNLRWAGPS